MLGQLALGVARLPVVLEEVVEDFVARERQRLSQLRIGGALRAAELKASEFFERRVLVLKLLGGQ